MVNRVMVTITTSVAESGLVPVLSSEVKLRRRCERYKAALTGKVIIR
jgi:hypothetical protein